MEESRKIDPNQPAFPVLHSIDGNLVRKPVDEYKGLTIRLELAARFVAAMLTQEKIPLPDKAAEIGLFYADILLEHYNK